MHKFLTEFPLHYPGYVKENIGQHNITQLHLIGTKKHRELVQVVLPKTFMEKDWLPENSHRSLLTFILFSSATHLRETTPYLKSEVLLFQQEVKILSPDPLHYFKNLPLVQIKSYGITQAFLLHAFPCSEHCFVI